MNTEFDYLLNAYERTVQAGKPFEAGYELARSALFSYVRRLENAASRHDESDPLLRYDP